MEHVSTRKLLRLKGLGHEVEIPVAALVSLGVDTTDPRPLLYLLFGGPSARGGSKDLLGVYLSEESARVAFHELRERKAAGWWGEVISLDASGTHRQRFWFDAGKSSRAGAPEEGGGRRWWRRP